MTPFQSDSRKSIQGPDYTVWDYRNALFFRTPSLDEDIDFISSQNLTERNHHIRWSSHLPFRKWFHKICPSAQLWGSVAWGLLPRLCSVHLLVRVWEGPKLLTCDRGCLYFWGQELQLLGTRACITLQWEWGTAFNMFNCKAAASHCRNVCFFRLCFFFFFHFLCLHVHISPLADTNPRKTCLCPG